MTQSSEPRQEHDCSAESCGGFGDYYGPCGGCCSCLGGCVYDAQEGPEPVCRCGHLESAHDAGECWSTADNTAHPTLKCECSWYEPMKEVRS